MSDYPIPAHAAYVWLVGDRLFIGLPSQHGDVRSHTVTLPATTAGYMTLTDILRKRDSDRAPRITAPASPTGHQLNKVLAAMKRGLDEKHERRLVEKAEAETFLKELGL